MNQPMATGCPASGAPANAQRASWLRLLARAPQELLESGLGEDAERRATVLKAPTYGLMMVRARAGGTGERFNLGETTVTRCVLRLDEEAGEPMGVGYVLGRSRRRARLVALADALLQTAEARPALETRLLAPIRTHLAEQAQHLAALADSSRVDFTTVAREAAAPDSAQAKGDQA